MWTNDKYPFAHASLDGWFEDPDGKKGILEIKTTNILNSSQRRNWKDHYIPENYYVQVLHYLMVTEFDYVVVAAQLKSVFDGYVTKQTIYETVYRNEKEEEIAYLADEERKFWTCVEDMKAPHVKLPDL
jgi:predicted phage-related endonuclease